LEGGIPVLAGAIGIPIALFKLVLELKPNKPMKGAIKWGLIAGAVYVFVFWLNNVGNWVYAMMEKGTELLTTYPENLLSFVLGSIVLFALAVYTAYFSGKSIGTETVDKLNLKTIGAIIVVLGLVYFWNYMTWIYFGSNQLWGTYTVWYAWFLGHNMDLWLLTIPLVGLSLLFERKSS
jgi:small-conductance mechanosensitive channel